MVIVPGHYIGNLWQSLFACVYICCLHWSLLSRLAIATLALVQWCGHRVFKCPGVQANAHFCRTKKRAIIRFALEFVILAVFVPVTFLQASGMSLCCLNCHIAGWIANVWFVWIWWFVLKFKWRPLGQIQLKRKKFLLVILLGQAECQILGKSGVLTIPTQLGLRLHPPTHSKWHRCTKCTSANCRTLRKCCGGCWSTQFQIGNVDVFHVH